MEQSRDYALVTECLREHFSEEGIQNKGLLERRFDSQFRRELSDISFKFFKRYYLAEYFPIDDGDMHERLTNDIEGMVSSKRGIRKAVAWPRGTGKTTTCDLALPLWVICTSKYHYIILITAALASGKAHLRAVKDELTTNERILADFGNLRGPKWQEDEIVTSNEIMMTVLGAGMQIRGRLYKKWRPGLVLCDDLEDDESVRSDLQRLYRRDWFFKAVTKAGQLGRQTSFFYIGTKLHHDCLLKRLLEHPGFGGQSYSAVLSWAECEDLWEEWRGIYTNLQDPYRRERAEAYYKDNEAEMLRGAKTAWIGLSYYDLMLELVDGGRSTFATEYQNQPTDPSTRHFRHIGFFRRWIGDEGHEWLQPVSIEESTNAISPVGTSVRLSACKLYMSVDPSLGKTLTGDPSAIIVLAKSPNDEMFTLEADIQLRRPAVLIADILKYLLKYPSIRIAGLESVSFQILIKMGVEAEAAKLGLSTGSIRGLTGLGNKDARIESLQPDLDNGYLRLGLGQTILHNQLIEWPASSHNDGPDALEMVRTIARGDKVSQPSVVVHGELHELGTLLEPEGFPVDAEEQWYPVTIFR